MENALTPSSETLNRRGDHGTHVLVVEDIPVTREFLHRLLVAGDYRVTLAATAQAAKDALVEELPDLVVLDLLLPDFNGLEVCRFLRSRPGGEDIPVLIITVDERPSSHAEAVRAGADDFLRKPLLPVELQTRVRSLIRLRQLRAELRRDQEAILSLRAQQEELVQFVVHDLKNMLGILLCSVDLLDEEGGGGGVRHRQRIKDTARTMHGMVQSMLDLSVHEQAGLPLHPEEIPLRAWMEQVRLEMEPLVLSRKQTLTLDLEPDLVLRADFQLMQRVVFNLVENASKFGPAGSDISIKAERTPTGLRLQVADLGVGIPAKLKGLIFERFSRLGKGAAAPEGRGLGLAFCRLVVELHGGTIWVEENEPQGSRFLMELPS